MVIQRTGCEFVQVRLQIICIVKMKHAGSRRSLRTVSGLLHVLENHNLIKPPLAHPGGQLYPLMLHLDIEYFSATYRKLLVDGISERVGAWKQKRLGSPPPGGMVLFFPYIYPCSVMCSFSLFATRILGCAYCWSRRR